MKRNTKQQSYISEAVSELHHPTAQAIYEYVKKKCPSVSKGTIYRVLASLVQEGKINQIQIANGADFYDWNCMPHHHLVCETCGTICDIPADKIKTFRNDQECADMYIRTHRILFFGQCATCYAQTKKELSEHGDIQDSERTTQENDIGLSFVSNNT